MTTKRLLRHVFDQDTQPEPKIPATIVFITVLLISLILAAILFFSCEKAFAGDELSYKDTNRVVNAIYRTEGIASKYPYGIKSLHTTSKAHARQICLNSVLNANKRWIAAGRPGDFIVFLGKRYSPPSINPNWVRLVKYFLVKAVLNG